EQGRQPQSDQESHGSSLGLPGCRSLRGGDRYGATSHGRNKNSGVFRRALPKCSVDFCLAVSNDGCMGLSSIARALGRRGGLARARTLSPERWREIASQGGRSKALLRDASRRIRENFEYGRRVDALR